MKKNLRWLTVFVSTAAFAAITDLPRKNLQKEDKDIVMESQIERRRVQIGRSIRVRPSTSFLKVDDVEFDRARKYKLDQKTAELITQLETLIKRPGQKERVSELKMRLAELYFERSQGLAALEAQAWENQVKAWEALSEEQRKKTARPVLKTPKADAFRKRSLTLYRELEKMSRNADSGLVRRDEILYFLASTLVDLNQSNQALAYYNELVEKYKKSPRAFSARLNLADLYFETNQYAKAIPLLLLVASGEGLPKNENLNHIKAYALYKLGWSYMNTGAHDKAVLAFKKTIEVSRQGSSERRIVFENEVLNDLSHSFALAGQYKEGEDYFSNVDNSKTLMRNFRIDAAGIARDRGEFTPALNFYTKLIEEDPTNVASREFALEKVKIIQKKSPVKEYQAALDSFAKDYGQSSRWFSKQEANEGQLATLELVGLLRREAKNNHRIAQLKNRTEMFKSVLGYYDVYFKNIPNPNPDSAKNLSEMHFYYAELLYRLGNYALAQEQYKAVGTEGQYASAATYARILALRQAAKKKPEMAKEMMEATQAFVAANPKDPRAGDLLYSSAQQAFKSGSSEESLQTLHNLVNQFSDQKVGVESADRILFIQEKKGDLDALQKEVDAISANTKLMQTGGEDFQARIKEVSQSTRFKKVQLMPESSAAEKSAKAQAYLDLAQVVSGDLKEKALNNASVFAKQGDNAALAQAARNQLIKEFPNSGVAKDALFEAGESAALNGQWSEAVKNYQKFADKRDAKDSESALWNQIFIEAHQQDLWIPEFSPRRAPNADFVRKVKNFVEKYPKSSNRQKAIELLVFRKGATTSEVASYKSLPNLKAEERNLLNRADIVLQVRAGQNFDALVRKNPPQASLHPLLKESLAYADFMNNEASFNSYTRQKLDYSPARFGKSLQSKIATLEKLEKAYLHVVAYGNGERALESLERLFQMYRQLARDIDKAPANKQELENYSKPIMAKAVGFLKTCFDKGSELKISGDGMATCRLSAAETGADFGNLSFDILPEPHWLPQANDLHPLLKEASEAFLQGRKGEADLALKVFKDKSKKEPTLDEAAVIENLKGLLAYNEEANDDAARSFLRAQDQSITKSAAIKNLTALYLQVSDFEQATEAIQSMHDQDADTLLLYAVSLKGAGDLSMSMDIFEKGLSRYPNNANLLFNAALTLGSSNLFREAAKKMQRYIELENPPKSHISRSLLRQWKEHQDESLPDT